MNTPDKLAPALWEADRHADTLLSAIDEWRQLTPVTALDAQHNKALVRLIDQILFRFAKLQDCMGERLVPATLAHLAEPYESWPMRDRLNRLEKLGYLNADTWLRWRDIRNHLSHEYPESADTRLAALQAAIQAAAGLAEAYRFWRAKVSA